MSTGEVVLIWLAVFMTIALVAVKVKRKPIIVLDDAAADALGDITRQRDSARRWASELQGQNSRLEVLLGDLLSGREGAEQIARDHLHSLADWEQELLGGPWPSQDPVDGAQ